MKHKWQKFLQQYDIVDRAHPKSEKKLIEKIEKTRWARMYMFHI
jgi:hypothetical protein